jgi:hypothetical protein
LLYFVLFVGLNWKLVQNIRLRLENTSMMIFITSKVQVCPYHLENQPRQIDRSTLNLIDRNSSVEEKSINRNSIERYKAIAKIDWTTFDRATSRVDRAISNFVDKVANINPICLRFKIQKLGDWNGISTLFICATEMNWSRDFGTSISL